jgi:hypothetical protein
MEFEKDILISYAHIDDEVFIEGDKGWIDNFHRSLEIRLAQLLGEKPKIWRDPKLQGNDYFGDEIVDQFPNIALLISVISPRYIKSEWCIKEVEEFIKACHENIGIRVQNKSRIFKVVKTPVDLNEHPAPIRGLLGYDFFTIDPQTGRPKEFNKMYGQESELAYWSKLNDVAHDITELLKNMKASNQEKAKSISDKPKEEKIKVYLSQTSRDLLEYRESIKRELQEHGFTVYPDISLPLVVEDFKSQVREMMGQCDLSVHLIGDNYGIVPEGTNKSTIVLQNDIALNISRDKPLKRLIWFPPDLKPEDKRQSEFIEELNNSEEVQKNADLLESSIDEFKFTLHKHLSEIEKEKTQKNTISAPPGDHASDGAPPMVYLICDQRDLDNIGELEDLLFDEGYEVILPFFDGDEGQVRLDHQENLKTCDAVLIYYGEGNELWMRSKTRELLKIAGYGRPQPLKCKGIVLAPPLMPSKERIRAHDTIILDCTNGLTREKINPFIEKVNQLKT